MYTIPHTACRFCVHQQDWPAGGECAACYWNGALKNHFTPKPAESRRTAGARRSHGRRRHEDRTAA